MNINAKKARHRYDEYLFNDPKNIRDCMPLINQIDADILSASTRQTTLFIRDQYDSLNYANCRRHMIHMLRSNGFRTYYRLYWNSENDESWRVRVISWRSVWKHPRTMWYDWKDQLGKQAETIRVLS